MVMNATIVVATWVGLCQAYHGNDSYYFYYYCFCSQCHGNDYFKKKVLILSLRTKIIILRVSFAFAKLSFTSFVGCYLSKSLSW